MRPQPRPRLLPRPLSVIAVLLIALAAVFGVGAPAANAAASTTTCTGTSPITYSPGITFTPRTVTYTEADNLSTCVSTDPTLTSGSAYSVATITGSCLSPLTVDADPYYTVHWNNGQSSTFDLTYTDTIAAGIENVTGTGTVTAGEFLGGTGTFEWIYTVPDPLRCLTTGATSQSGTLVATILAT